MKDPLSNVKTDEVGRVFQRICTPNKLVGWGRRPTWDRFSSLLDDWSGTQLSKGEPTMFDDDDTTRYRVVVNHEEQYSIWPEGRDIPPGWREAGKSGPKSECLEWVKEVWTDMRPLSLRKQMDGET